MPKVGVEKRQDIRVCKECGTPLIMTFMVPYKEFYCTGCGDSSEFLGAGRMEGWTPKLHEKQEETEKKFKAAHRDMVPEGARMNGCDKCNRSATHRMHMTDKERAADVKARKDLKGLLLPEYR